MSHKTQKIFFICIIFILIAALPACWPFGRREKKIFYKDFVMINVLDEKLYNDCHIPGSINVMVPDIEAFAQENIDKKAEIVFYCSNYMCSASEFARKKLSKSGFENVFVYEGGMADWYQHGYTYVGKAESPYLQRKIPSPPERPIFDLTAQQLKEKIEIYKKL